MKIKLTFVVEDYDGNIGHISTYANLDMPISATKNRYLNIRSINGVTIDCTPDEREEYSDE